MYYDSEVKSAETDLRKVKEMYGNIVVAHSCQTGIRTFWVRKEYGDKLKNFQEVASEFEGLRAFRF